MGREDKRRNPARKSWNSPICICLQYGIDEIRINLLVEAGMVTDFQVIYLTMLNGHMHQVLRYDCAHGFPHKDVLFTKPKRKVRIQSNDYKRIIDDAICDIRENWREYKAKYLRELEKNG
jgi:hypothetical protein